MLRFNLKSLGQIKKGSSEDRILDRYLLLIIIAVGAVLRCWNLFNIPFSHDELSAVIRTHFGSFHELIEQGVKVDGHPAGIQVFLFYWIKLFGEEEWLVKLPFIISGILSIPLVYLLGRRWFSSGTALVSAAFMASLQFPVMYSQSARPYATGLFLVLAMVYCWDNIVFSGKKELFWYIGFIFSGAACAYNHHFSLLMAVIAGFSGLFLVKKDRYLKYILAGMIILLLYIPHLSVLSDQLRLRGLGWLGKPDACFLFDYIKYIFHFSWFEAAMLLLILFATLDFTRNNLANSKWILSLSWFTLPIVIGFSYSILVQPVLQYSVLLFSFPFLLFILFGRVKWLKPLLRITVVVAILIVSTLSLIFERHHYALLYSSVFKEIPMQAQKAYASIGKNGCSIILDGDRKKFGYYMSRLKTDFPFVWADSFPSRPEFIKYLHSLPQKTLILGLLTASDPVRRSLVENEFPFLCKQKDYVTGNFFIFSRDSASGARPAKRYSSLNVFDNENMPNWSTIFPEYLSDLRYCSPHTSYKLMQKMEWGPQFSIAARDFISNTTDWIDISASIYSTDSLPPEVLLVSSIKSGNKEIMWNAARLSDFWIHPGWNRVNLSVSVFGLPVSRKNVVFSSFIWNKGLSEIFLDDFEIAVKKGNPVVYGLIYKIETR